MKSIICLVLFFSLVGSIEAQVPFTKPEFCKSSEIEIITGEVFPESHVILGIGNFLKDTGFNSIETLSPKLIRNMKKLASHFKSCKVFVDFKNLVGGFTDGNGNDLGATHVHYFVIRPFYYLM